MSAEQRDRLLQELRRAVDSGLSTVVLEDCSALLALPAVELQVADAPSRHLKVIVLHEILRSLLRRQGREWQALRELADLTTVHPRRGEQRQRAAARALRADDPYTTRHVRRLYTDQLLPQLLTALEHYDLDVQSGQWTAQLDELEARVPPGSPLLIPPYVVEEIEGTWRFEDRYPREMLETWRIRALREGASTFVLMNEYLDRVRTLGEVEVTIGGEAYLDNIVQAASGSYSIVAGFPPARAQQRLRIRLGIRFDRDIPGCQVYGFWAEQHARRLTVRVEFDRDRLPNRIWRLEGIAPRLSGVEILREAERSCPPADVSPAGYVEELFTEMKSGLTYGLGWRW